MKNYIEETNTILKPKKAKNLEDCKILDLFAGCGGLALGFEAKGFVTVGFEIDENACATYNKNLKGKCHQELLTVDTDYPKADIVIGGPPCQPFSVGGKQNGLKDLRDGFPVFISAVEKVKPQLFMFENVRGILYKNKWYLKEVIEKLESFNYRIDYKLLNAVNYGVPQNRERVFVVGIKDNHFEFPEPLSFKITAGEALGDIAFEEPPDGKYLTPSMDKYIAKYEKASKCINPRDLHLDRPARSLTCRNLAGATGDMQRIKLPSGKRRRLRIREAARLQSFPDWSTFEGNENSQFYQIGNAVPPLLGYHIARKIKDYILQRNSFPTSLFDYNREEKYA